MPSNEDAIKFVRSHLATHVLVIYAVARVSYNGRAKANLNANPYLIIIKPDGTFMVHGSRREKPLIWNPPGSRTYIEARDGLVVLLSIRASPAERVIADLDRVDFIGAFDVEHSDNKVMGTESDLVAWLVDHPDYIEKGFMVLEREYDTAVGRIDILGRDANGRLVVVEVKRSQAGPDAVNQLLRYVDHLLQRRGEKPRGVLVSPDISPSAHFMLKSNGLEYLKVNKDLTTLMEKGTSQHSARPMPDFYSWL
ncbi:endonuclease NucS [Thermocladium modestius]|uniref:Endonuclease NucS n=2 Tax=Thermocladium modestius TaxID=62609 RepID=A0A830GXK0_9CREN|nr:endonuclease NucS [Thermocladium modestius]